MIYDKIYIEILDCSQAYKSSPFGIRYKKTIKTLEETTIDKKKRIEVITGISISKTRVSSKNSGISSNKTVIDNIELEKKYITVLEEEKEIKILKTLEFDENFVEIKEEIIIKRVREKNFSDDEVDEELKKIILELEQEKE